MSCSINNVIPSADLQYHRVNNLFGYWITSIGSLSDRMPTVYMLSDGTKKTQLLLSTEYSRFVLVSWKISSISINDILFVPPRHYYIRQVVKNANGWVVKISLQGGQKPSRMSPPVFEFWKKGELEGVLFPLVFTPRTRVLVGKPRKSSTVISFHITAIGDHSTVICPWRSCNCRTLTIRRLISILCLSCRLARFHLWLPQKRRLLPRFERDLKTTQFLTNECRFVFPYLKITTVITISRS